MFGDFMASHKLTTLALLFINKIKKKINWKKRERIYNRGWDLYFGKGMKFKRSPRFKIK